MSASCIKDPTEHTDDNDGPSSPKKTDAQSWLNMLTAMLNFAMTSTDLMMSIQSRAGVCGICHDENRELIATLAKLREQFSSDLANPKEPGSCDPNKCNELYESQEAGKLCQDKQSSASGLSVPEKTSSLHEDSSVVKPSGGGTFEEMRQLLDLPCYCKDFRECKITDDDTPCLVDGKPPQPNISPATSTVESLEGATIPVALPVESIEPPAMEPPGGDIPSRKQCLGSPKFEMKIGVPICGCTMSEQAGGTGGGPFKPPDGTLTCGNIAADTPDLLLTIGIKANSGGCCCHIIKHGDEPAISSVTATAKESSSPEKGTPSGQKNETEGSLRTCKSGEESGTCIRRPVSIASLDSYCNRKSSNICAPPSNLRPNCIPQIEEDKCEDCDCESGNEEITEIEDGNCQKDAAEDGNCQTDAAEDGNCQTDACEELSKHLQMMQLEYHLKQTDETLKELKKEVERISELITSKRKPPNEAAAALYREIMRPRTSIEEVARTPMCCRRPSKRSN